MKAKNTNGTIEFYGEIPVNYKSDNLGLILGFNQMDESTWKNEGFFDVITPSYDYYTEALSDIYLDEANQVYTYNVLKLDTPIEKPKMTMLSKVDFLTRFTEVERIAIYTEENINIVVKMWLEMFRAANSINLKDQATIDGVNALESAGILATGRAAEILI